MSVVRMTARWYDDVFPAEVVRQQEAWEQLRLVRRLRASPDLFNLHGIELFGTDAAERKRLMIVRGEDIERARDEVSPIEYFLAKAERWSSFNTAMADSEMRERLFAEWDRVTRFLADRKVRVLAEREVANEKAARKRAKRKRERERAARNKVRNSRTHTNRRANRRTRH